MLAAVFTEAALCSQYYSGAIQTKDYYQYGKFKASIKTGNHYGTVASFFTYWDGPNWHESEWNEIDVEIVPSVQSQGKSPFSTNLIYGDGHSKQEEQKYVDFDHNWDAFHTYEIEWTPDYISWTVDGKQVRRSESSSSRAVRYTNKKQKLEMNFWTPTWNSWGGGRNDSNMPWYVYYDWIEAYSYDHSSKQFHLTWRDDFNGSRFSKPSSSRWHISDGATFGSNSSMFVNAHVYLWDGSLCLKMSKSRSSEQQGENYDALPIEELLLA